MPESFAPRSAEPSAEGASDFYAQHLERVSRSFAPCIAQLELPLRPQVGLAYLLARLLDTAEDAPWAQPTAQQRCLSEALQWLLVPTDAAQIARWAATLPTCVPPGERALLASAPRLVADLHRLPALAKQAIVAPLHRMAAGMRQFAGHRDPQGAQRLATLADVNRYCYVVAGVVGEMLTALLQLSHASFVATAATQVDAVHFGLFLQKVNLLKDQPRDEQEGRFWLPDRAQVQQSLRPNVQGAGRYLQAIPKQAAKFRLFCAWSLFLGARSLGLYDGQSEAAKIPRAEAEALFAELGALVQDDAALAAAIQQAVEQAEAALPPLAAAAPAAAPGAAWSEAQWSSWLASLDPAPRLGATPPPSLGYPEACALGMA